MIKKKEEQRVWDQAKDKSVEGGKEKKRKRGEEAKRTKAKGRRVVLRVNERKMMEDRDKKDRGLYLRKNLNVKG